MTKEEVVELGMAAQRAKDIFQVLCYENTKTDPVERAAQTKRYEQARANMHEAMNRHHAALELL